MFNSNSLGSKYRRRKRFTSLSRGGGGTSSVANQDGRHRCLSTSDVWISPFSSLGNTLNDRDRRRYACHLVNTVRSRVDDFDMEEGGKATLKVYNEDGTYKTVSIDDGMRVGEVCEMMLQKNHQDDSIVHWQLYGESKHFPGCERQIEDNEFAIDLKSVWPTNSTPSRIWFRYNQRKYIFSASDGDRAISQTYGGWNRKMMHRKISPPDVTEGTVMLKRPREKWTRVFCFFIMSTVFFTKKGFNSSKKKAKYLVDLTGMDIYVPQAGCVPPSSLNSPTPHTLLLVPSSIGLLDPGSIFAICVNSRECLLAWAETLRFYKQGHQRLIENLEDALNGRYRPSDKTPTPSQLNSLNIVTQTPPPYYERTTRGSKYSSRFSRQSLLEDEFPNIFDADDDLFFDSSPSTLPGPHTSIGRPPRGAKVSGTCLDAFEGIAFQSGKSFLLLSLTDGLYKFEIEVLQQEDNTGRSYKLVDRNEYFSSLDDLCDYYERRRHLFTDGTTARGDHLLMDGATAF